MRDTGLPSGTLYPLLYALADANLLEARWEEGSPRDLKRPRRRLYKLTSLGMITARDAVADFTPLILSPTPSET